MSESTDELWQMILQLRRKSQNVGLKMNMKKTKAMLNNYILDHEIKIHDKVIEYVQDYIYLGEKIGSCTDHENEIKRRIGMGWSAFFFSNNTML